MRITAKALRSQGWWAVEVPEVVGLHTQVKRLDQVPKMVAEAASLLTGKPESDFDVEVLPDLPDDSELTKAVAEYVAKQIKLRELQREVQGEARAVATALHAKGVTYREIGAVLGVSHQRVHQLVS
ncbi:hypothetical protein GCM10009596_20390 [Arthrobacter rhombi]|uniref:hypothetical protein n=1 Tax=Arthrobacter rhombi TaxID=71253 RepID=UPI0031E293AF